MFERAFVINLPHRKDRRRQMERQLNLAHIEAEFFPAFSFEDPGGFYRKGSRGNFMSHLAILKSVKSRSVLIMEDDLNFCTDRMPALKKLPGDWAIFYASFNGVIPSQGHVFQHLHPSTVVQGSHFYAVNGYVVPILAQALETF